MYFPQGWNLHVHPHVLLHLLFSIPLFGFGSFPLSLPAGCLTVGKCMKEKLIN
jgi:hypothetical protein